MEGGQISDEITRMRRRIKLGVYSISDTHSSDFPGNYPGVDDSWKIEEFKEGFAVHIGSLNEEEMEFDMIGIDASIANAIRRILLAEVPTMAIEKVFVHNNTSIIQDEVLAHRLGLIPIRADPRDFEMLPPREETEPFPEPSGQHMLEFSLKVKCRHNPKAPKKSEDRNELYLNTNVLTGDMEWVPIGDQASKLTGIQPVQDDILIAKMLPCHEIDVRMLCVKGIGQDHAKFSPVATASYRLLPEITLTQPVRGEQATRLAKCFSPGVIKVCQDKNGERYAKVVHPRRDTCSREVLRHEDLEKCVELSRVRDHFIFSVESTGALPPNVLVEEAVKILMKKCQLFLRELDNINRT